MLPPWLHHLLNQYLNNETAFLFSSSTQHTCQIQVWFQWVQTRSLLLSLGYQSHWHYYHRGLESSINNRWFNLSFPFQNKYPCSIVLSIIITAIKATTYNKGDIEFPWNIPGLILTSLFFPENKTVLQHCVFLSSSSEMFLDVPTSSRVFRVFIQLPGTLLYTFKKSIRPSFRFVFLLLVFLIASLPIKSWSFAALVFRRQPFCSSGSRFYWFIWSKMFSLLIPVCNFQRRFKRDIGLQLPTAFSFLENFCIETAQFSTIQLGTSPDWIQSTRCFTIAWWSGENFFNQNPRNPSGSDAF